MTAGRTLWPAPFLDQRGNRRAGLPILVYVAGKGPEPDGDGTLQLADLYLDDALTVPRDQLANPVTTDADGNETAIKAAPGVYDAFVGGETISFAIVDPFGSATIVTETPAATVTLDLSDGKPRRYVTLESDTTLAVTNDDDQPIFLVIVDTGTGGHSLTFWDGIKWATDGGAAPTVTPEADARDVFSFIKLGVADYLGFVVGQGLVIPPPATVPDAPTNLLVTPGNGQASIAFDAPGSNGGSPITSYTVTVTPTGGTSPTAPDAPTGVVGTAGDGQVSVAFTPPVSDGGSAITSYTVTVS